jgi:hypothetical protein
VTDLLYRSTVYVGDWAPPYRDITPSTVLPPPAPSPPGWGMEGRTRSIGSLRTRAKGLGGSKAEIDAALDGEGKEEREVQTGLHLSSGFPSQGPSACPALCLSACYAVCLSVCLPVCLSVCPVVLLSLVTPKGCLGGLGGLLPTFCLPPSAFLCLSVSLSSLWRQRAAGRHRSGGVACCPETSRVVCLCVFARLCRERCRRSLIGSNRGRKRGLLEILVRANDPIDEDSAACTAYLNWQLSVWCWKHSPGRN